MTLQRFQQSKKFKPIPRGFRLILNRIFGSVGVTLITQISLTKGAWKLGKTDFALYLSQILLQLGLVSEVASNIYTQGHYPQISDMISLKSWLHRNNRRKLYILDEMNKHLKRRRAMSSKNVEILDILPEISKARARLMGVGQDIFSVDKEFTKDIWVKGIFIKRNLKKAQLISRLLSRPKVFCNVPKTSVPFDPYEIAPFTLKPKSSIMFKDVELQRLYRWAKGASWREEFKHPNECGRFTRRVVLKLLEKTFTDTLNK